MYSVVSNIINTRELVLNRVASSGVVFIPGFKKIGKLLPIILKHMNQRPEE